MNNPWKAFIKTDSEDDYADDLWSSSPWEAFMTGKPMRVAKPLGFRDDAIRHQNYVDSLQMEREKRMSEERDAQEKARRKRQEEIRLREEERIRKIKSSFGYKVCKTLGSFADDPKKLEEKCLKQEEEKLNELPWIPPRPYWSK